MKAIKYIFMGMIFGMIMTKGEVISWYRIYEMFKFDSFHMYGIIGSAVGLGIIGFSLIKKLGIKDINGNVIEFTPKAPGTYRTLIGGTIFGLGWAMTGACPGPMFTLVGNSYSVFLVVIISATLGTFIYGLVRHRLPH